MALSILGVGAAGSLVRVGEDTGGTVGGWAGDGRRRWSRCSDGAPTGAPAGGPWSRGESPSWDRGPAVRVGRNVRAGGWGRMLAGVVCFIGN
jgi:hypothetical protein